MKKLFSAYRVFFTPERLRSLLASVFFLALALVAQSFASSYSMRNSNQFVGDFFLEHLPIINLNLIIIEGAFCAILLTIILLFLKPSRLIFTLKAIAIFIATRAFMISITHLGVYPGQITPDPGGFLDSLYSALNLQAGYFFSAHTGLPILMALIFWDKKLWRYVFLALSVVFGISVLIAHVHYSIDVFAAPFMAYSIFKLAQYLFTEDYALIGTDDIKTT